MRTRTRQKPKPGSGTVLRAAIYIRVSSEELVQGYSLDAQDRAGQIYCDAQGWGIVERYRDEGVSARADDVAKRPDDCRCRGGPH